MPDLSIGKGRGIRPDSPPLVCHARPRMMASKARAAFPTTPLSNSSAQNSHHREDCSEYFATQFSGQAM